LDNAYGAYRYHHPETCGERIMKREFIIFGDYGYADQTELERFNSSQEAVRWAKQYTWRDLGGYQQIEVIEFADDGEAITHFRKKAEDED